MAVYAYTAATGPAQRQGLVRGTITADSSRQARDQLRAQGLAVRDIVEQSAGKSAGRLRRYLMARQSGKVTGLLQEISTLLAAGIALLEALDTIASQHTGRFQQSILLLRDHVASGGSLAEAMAKQDEIFDTICVSIVEVGENSGTLDTALSSLIEFRRRNAGIKNRVASAMMYPCIVSVVGVAVSMFMMTYVAPKLLGVLSDSGKQLPTATVIVKAISDFLIDYRWVWPPAVAALVAGFMFVLRSEKGSRYWHRLQLKIPLLGDLVRKQAIARMAMVMATLLKSDVVFVRAVQIARKTVNNSVLRDALDVCEQSVSAGRDISDALSRSDVFPPLVVQVFAVGQASGRLEEMLENLATDYDTQVDISATRLTTLLEPIMMVLLAVLVGFIAFATILPILEAGDVL